MNDILIGVWDAKSGTAGTDTDPHRWLRADDVARWESHPSNLDAGCLIHCWPDQSIRQSLIDDSLFIITGSGGRLGSRLPKKPAGYKPINIDDLRARPQLSRAKLRDVRALALPPVELMGGVSNLRKALERIGLESKDALALRDGYDFYEVVQERLLGKPATERGGSAMVAPYDPYEFTAADGTALGSLNGGADWTDHQAGLEVQSNEMSNPGGGEFISLATHADIANVKAVGQVTIPVSNSNNIGFLVRAAWGADISGYYGVWIRSSASLIIYRVTNGAFTSLATTTGAASAGPHEFLFRASGTALYAEIAGVYATSATDSTYSTGKTGFRTNTTNISTCDDFEVWDLDAGAGGGIPLHLLIHNEGVF